MQSEIVTGHTYTLFYRKMASNLESLDQTIFLLERVGSNESEILIGKLYKELRGIQSERRFAIKIREITDIIQRSFCDTDTCYSHWVVIYGLLFVCFRKHIDDSYTVAEIMKCMEKHVDSYCVFSDESLLKMELSPEIVKGRKKSGLKSYSFLAYYLHHANESRRVVKGERFIALTAKLQRHHRVMSQIMLTCLQYGGSFAGEERMQRSCIPDAVQFAFYDIMKYGVVFNLWDEDTLSFHVKPSDAKLKHSTLENMCSNFSVVLRDVRNPHEVTFLVASKFVRINGLQKLDPEVFVPFYDKLFPGCMFGRKIPPLLRHMCRRVIRKALYDNWKLPDGIDTLPVPELIRDYLNLLYD